MGHWIKDGDILKTVTSGDILVVKYHNSNSVDIKFLTTGVVRNVTTKAIKTGQIKDYYYPSVCGVGYQGEISTREGGEASKTYIIWRNMIHRCYSKVTQEKQPTYKGCEVSDYFKCYKNFYDWYVNQQGCGEEDWALDKDLLLKSDKMYSENHCVLLPREINTALISAKKVRGKYPIGVKLKRNIASPDKFQVAVSMFNKTTHIGTYTTEDEAFLVYKDHKERHLKVLAEKWKGKIDIRAYDALINYEVDIED